MALGNKKRKNAYRILLIRKTGPASGADLYLEGEGYEVERTDTFPGSVDDNDKNGFDMVAVEMEAGDVATIEEVREFRRESPLPLILLIHGCRTQDKTLGMSVGADDCFGFPSEPLEMIARVRSLLRRCYELSPAGNPPNRFLLKYGDLSLNALTTHLYSEGRNIPLTGTEYRLLLCMMNEPGRVFSQEELCGILFEEDGDPNINALMVHISHLREKIEKDPRKPAFIRNVRKRGYCFGKEKN